MTIKLVQKRFPKGSREFEIADDTVYVRIKGLLKQEKMAVGLSLLNPEPVVKGAELEFHSHTRAEPMLSLLIDNPDTETFNTFIDVLKQSVVRVSSGHAGDEADVPDAPQSGGLGWNVYEEPSWLGESEQSQKEKIFKPVNPDRLDSDITMLQTYLEADDIRPLIDAVEALKAEPDNEAAFQKLVDTFNAMGISQGAVLTYAPYLKVLLSDTAWS